MSIDPALVNVFDLTIRRPNRTGPAGDTNPLEDQVIATRIPAVFEAVQRVAKGPSGDDLLINGIYHINPCEPSGAQIGVRARDYLEHTDLVGDAVRRRVIVFVSVWTLLPVDHIELEVAGRAVLVG